MNWQILFMALGLVIVFEGLLPFISPLRYRRFLKVLEQQSDHMLRRMGLGAMLLGLAILIFTHFSN